jgi:uncharacterized protein
MTRDEVLRLLGERRAHLARFGVRSLAVFGSVARDQGRPDSDVDVLVEFAQPASFAAFMDLKFFLEDLLGRRVDLVTRKALKPRLRPEVEKEAIHVRGF